MTSRSKKAATTNDQGVDAREVWLQVAELLLDGLADWGGLVFLDRSHR
jgi:hypothetical protein